MSKSIRLTIDGKEFSVSLKDNQTVNDILKMLPLELTLQRYAEHEYYGKLPQKPSIKGVLMTSSACAGGIYYYDGWSAFTVLYGDAYIAPYEVVHIGDVEPTVIEFLKNSDTHVSAKIEIINH
ncbi:MAG: cyclophilin-like fold protein [Bacteroidota bacterium]|nr:cyclophilin-like fold protein [Bacteroidota bacterium]